VLVTPTSQIVGTQAVMNVLAGERYKMVTKESKGLMRGEYGQLPAPVNEDIRRKIIGDDKVITHRPADDIAPELEKYREEIKDWAQQDEDVLSYALFPQVAMKFFAWRKEKQEGTLLPEISVKVLS
jgi:oxaloacetate decarboxylase alpha subunit